MLETIEEKKQGNKFSIISLVLFVCSIIADFLDGALSALHGITTANNYGEPLSSIIYLLIIICTIISWALLIAAFVLMIYVRVKYPKNTFGKVLMWVYISVIVIYMIFIIVIFISIGLACGACIIELENCSTAINVIKDTYLC
jgi:hypothetical protein